MLKTLILAFLPFAAAALAEQQPAQPVTPGSKVTKAVPAKPAGPMKATSPATAAKVPAKPAATPASAINGIPVGAVKLDENTYRFQEKDASGRPGKVWLYRRNPFGVSRISEADAARIAAPSQPIEVPATATDLGDSYRFERSGPFGAKVWTSKKSELNADERSIVDKVEKSKAGKADAPVTGQKAVN